MEQPELDLRVISEPGTVQINGKCMLKKRGDKFVVYITGLPVYTWKTGDKVAEGYAMVSLVNNAYAKQSAVARAFGISERTLRRKQSDYESRGMDGLRSEGGRPRGSKAEPQSMVKAANTLKQQGMNIRDIASCLRVGKSTVSRWTKDQKKPENPKPDRAGESRQNSFPGMDKATVDDPENRLYDRMLAREGLLYDAEPIFSSGRNIPHAGVLL